jgi:uncharacterized protein YjaG (DUF416 family)
MKKSPGLRAALSELRHYESEKKLWLERISRSKTSIGHAEAVIKMEKANLSRYNAGLLENTKILEPLQKRLSHLQLTEDRLRKIELLLQLREEIEELENGSGESAGEGW